MPIAMPKSEWNRLVKWTELHREDPETVRRREYVKMLDQRSQSMTKSWPNSLENVNRRNEELRLARIADAEQSNSRFYKKYVKRQREEQQRLMYSARDTIFKNKDAPKFLLNAVIETAVQKERNEQIKFNAERRKESIEKKRLDDEEIIRKAKEWHEHVARQKANRRRFNKETKMEIVGQIQDNEKMKREQYETEVNQQKLDNIKADEEMQVMKEFEQDFKDKERERIWRDMARSKAETEELRKEKVARDELSDKLQKVLEKSDASVQAKRLETMLRLKDAKFKILEKLSKNLASGTQSRDAKENASLEKAIKEKNDIADARAKAQQDKLDRFKRERQEARAQYLRDEETRMHEADTRNQWDLINRYKNNEIYAEFLQNQDEGRINKIKEYKETITKQWKECDEKNALEKAETRYFYGELAERRLREADNKLLTHAQALLEEAEREGRPDYALRRAISKYCIYCRLYPMPDLQGSMKEHFPKYKPVDASKPDPWYSDEPAPPRELTKDEEDALEAAEEAGELPPPDPAEETPAPSTPSVPLGRRDGVPDLTKVGPFKPVVTKVDAYKRQGPANGMQRKSDDFQTLPPITGRPCACCRRKE